MRASMPTRLKDGQDSGALLGKGHLAMTIDQGPDMSRYQGLVALDGGTLEDAAHEYFLRSEQIPTRVRLAVGEEWRGGEGEGPKHRWRAGGMLLQFLPKAPERARQADLHPGDAPEGVVTHTVEEDDAWVEGQSLIATVEDVELIDPDLSGERLLYRLFHERGVRVFPPLPLRAQCSCSRDAVSAMLNSFAPGDRADMVKDGKVVVTCEFCSLGLPVHAARGGRGGVGARGVPGFRSHRSLERDADLSSPAPDGAAGQLRSGGRQCELFRKPQTADQTHDSHRWRKRRASCTRSCGGRKRSSRAS